MAKRKMPKEVFLPIGKMPKYVLSYFLYSGNGTHNSWRLKRAYPAQAREVRQWSVKR